MVLTALAPDGAVTDPLDVPKVNSFAVAATAGFQALFAAAAGLLFTCGLALVLWAVTPSSGAAPGALLRSGVVAFGAANGMTVAIGGAMLTLTPLLGTVIAVALLAAGAGRGRVAATTRSQELIAISTAASVYAIVVTVLGVAVGSRGALRADQWWRPALLAVVVIGCTTLVRSPVWRSHLTERLPRWVPVSIRLGAVGAGALVAGGAVTLVIAMVESFGDSVRVQTIAAPGAGSGFGMALLCVAFLPNAVVAAIGYSTGVGFTVGSGTYSLFGSTRAEMPAISLLTATPDGTTPPRPTLLLLLIPVVAALLIARGVVRRLDRREDRLLAVVGAAIIAAIVMMVLSLAASGGVTGGEWSTSGVPAAQFGLVVLVALGGIGAATVAVARVPASAMREMEEAEPLEDAEPIEDADSVDEPEPIEEPADFDEEAEFDEAAELEEVEPDDEPEEEPTPPREEDVIAEAEAGTDEDLVAELEQPPSPASAPRQVG